jgi:hypothetical protein
MMRIIVFLVIVAMVVGCATNFKPQTEAERESGYTYIPIDPFPVETVPGDSCRDTKQEKAKIFGTLLQSLPDNAVRMLIEKFNALGTVTYGPAKLGAKGESYRVTVDYINADTINMAVWIAKIMEDKNSRQTFYVNMNEQPGDRYKPGYEAYIATRKKPNEQEILEHNYTEFNIPVYVGIGLRVTANVEVIGANANISGIGVIGAEAEAEKIKGSLIVQTLGVNGKSIAAALPIQSELNRTTAQNAIVAVGSIKALLYAEETVVSPRVVGIYLPFPGGKPLVNALISELSRDRVEWRRPCLVPANN